MSETTGWGEVFPNHKEKLETCLGDVFLEGEGRRMWNSENGLMREVIELQARNFKKKKKKRNTKETATSGRCAKKWGRE